MFKSVMLTVTLSFFALSSAEAVKNGNIFNTDDWFKDFKNIFKRPAAPIIPQNKSHKVIKEAILMDFKNGQKAVYTRDGLKFNTNRPIAPFVMTPTHIRYGDVLINRRLPLSQLLEGLKNSKTIKKAELRTVTASNTEVYTSTRCVVESDIVASYLNDKRSESKSTFNKEKDRQNFLNKKSREFEADLASFLNASSAKPAQSKAQAQEKPVAKPKTPAKAAPSRVKPAAPSKQVVAPANKSKNTKQATRRRATANSKTGIQRNRFAARRATVTTRPAVQRNIRAKRPGFGRRR